MTTTEDITNTHATNLRDEQAPTGEGMAPGVWDFIQNVLAYEDEDEAQYMVRASVENMYRSAFTEALSYGEALSVLHELEEKLNNPEVRAVMIGDFLVPVDRIRYVYMDEAWEEDVEEEGE